MPKIDLNKKHDLTNINWDMGIDGSSQGVLPKTTIDVQNEKLFLKLSSFSKPFGFYGMEAIIELINSRIGQVLNLPVLEYDLKYASIILDTIKYDTFVSVSKNYRGKGIRAISFENFYSANAYANEDTLNFSKRCGFHQTIYKEFLFDYIICNLDRHGKNTEILFDANKKWIAPFFDNSLTYLSNRPENEIKSKTFFNDMLRVNNFIGGLNLLQNILKIDSLIKVRVPRKEDRQYIFQGLGKITTQEYRDFVWVTLNRRVEDVKSKKIPYIQWF